MHQLPKQTPHATLGKLGVGNTPIPAHPGQPIWAKCSEIETLTLLLKKQGLGSTRNNWEAWAAKTEKTCKKAAKMCVFCKRTPPQKKKLVSQVYENLEKSLQWRWNFSNSLQYSSVFALPAVGGNSPPMTGTIHLGGFPPTTGSANNSLRGNSWGIPPTTGSATTVENNWNVKFLEWFCYTFARRFCCEMHYILQI